MSKRADRRSNIELLRIIAAIGVIILHYNNAKLGGGFSGVKHAQLNQGIMTFFEVLFICAVNLYVLISGYFMRHSYRRDWLKPIQLLAQIVVFSLGFFIVKELILGKGFSGNVMFQYFTRSYYWFVYVFIGLYVISPFINMMWDALSVKNRKVLLGVSLGLFSVFSILGDILQYYYGEAISGISVISLGGTASGYSIVNFVLMYLIGCYLKDLEDAGKKYKTGKLVLLFVLNIFGLFIWTYLEHLITGQKLQATTAWKYENPLVITAAVLFFMIFNNIDIGCNKVINKLAGASFPAYLMHINFLEYCNIKKTVKGETWLYVLHTLGCAIAIYLICFVIYFIYDLATKPLFSCIDRHWKKGRYIEVKEKEDREC